MVVEEDDGGGGGRRRLAEDFPRMDDRRIEGANGDHLHADDAMLRIEHDDAELLHRQAAELGKQVCGELLRRAELRPIGPPLYQRAAPELDGGKHLRRACRPDTGHAAQCPGVGPYEPMQSARGVEQAVRDGERVTPARSIADDQREEFVVAKTRGTKTCELLPRPIVWGDIFHLYSVPMSCRPLRASATACCLAALLLAGCAAPPNQEIGDAQNALKAARAAGAERYAAESYTAAAEAYRVANEAVLAGDYRLALNRAIESRDFAQTALRAAEEAHAQAREDAQRQLEDLRAQIARLTADIEAADGSRAARRLRDVRATLTLAQTELQEAGAALERDDLDAAQATMADVRVRLDVAAADFKATAVQSTKRRGR